MKNKTFLIRFTSHEIQSNSLPLQTTKESEPVFVYPTLHVHLTAYVVLTCEHTAFVSQPPFLTLQLSRVEENRNDAIHLQRICYHLCK